MVMGEGDTAFAVGGTEANGLDRVIAFSAADGTSLWSSSATRSVITPIAATAGGGIAVGYSDRPDSAQTVVRYDASGAAVTDSLNAPSLQYFASDAWMGALADGGQSLMTNAGLEWALSPWDSPRGAQRPDASADPKIELQLRVFSIYRTSPEDIQSNATVATRVNDAIHFWWKTSKIQMDWDSNILSVPACDREQYPFGCTTAQPLFGNQNGLSISSSQRAMIPIVR